MSKRLRSWRLALALLVTAGAAGAYAWQPWQTSAPAAAVLTARVERGDVEDSTTALGSLQPYQYVDVGTQVSGQVRGIAVELGARVTAGDLVAEIDPTVYASRVEADRAQLEVLRAQLAEREAQAALAEQRLRRQAGLRATAAASGEDYDAAVTQRKVDDAQVAAVKAQIRQAESTLRGDEANLSYTKIYAPMTGTVVSLPARKGQTLNAVQQAPTLLRIADLSRMTVTTQVSEADVGKLTLGMEAYFTTLGRPDRKVRGTLRQILPTPEVVNNVVLYNALFDVDNPDGSLMTQMSVQVFFVAAAVRDVPVVPVSALKPVARPAGGGRGEAKGEARAEDAARDGKRPGSGRRKEFLVQVLKADGATEERAVTVGVMSRVSAEVVSGLAVGETVVTGAKPQARPAAAPSGPPAGLGGARGGR